MPFWLIHLLQGGWENDETVEEAAAREAIEEAGVRGDLVVRYQNKQTHKKSRFYHNFLDTKY